MKKGHRSEQDSGVLADIQARSPEDRPGAISYFQDPAENVEKPRYSESDRLLGFLGEHAGRTILIAARGEASAKLSYLTTQYLMFAGSRIHTLRRQGGYAAVIDRKRVIAELIDNRKSVVLDDRFRVIASELFATGK